MNYQTLSNQVLELYLMADVHTEAYGKTLGARCVPGCSECCKNHYVEATVLEMLPLGVLLWITGEAPSVHERIVMRDSNAGCILYDPSRTGQGHCTRYLYRPLICRLFGFSAVPDKHGNAQAVLCEHMKRMSDTHTEQTVCAQYPAPFMKDYSLLLHTLCPSLGDTFHPVNEALRIAIERVGCMYAFSKKAQARTASPLFPADRMSKT